MEYTCDIKAEKTRLKLQEFCDMNQYIAKPIKIDELMSALTEILKEQKESAEK